MRKQCVSLGSVIIGINVKMLQIQKQNYIKKLYLLVNV